MVGFRSSASMQINYLEVRSPLALQGMMSSFEGFWEGQTVKGLGLLAACPGWGFGKLAEAGASQAGASQATRGLWSTTAGGGRGPGRPRKKRLPCFTRRFLGYLILGRPDGFLASDLPGPPCAAAGCLACRTSARSLCSTALGSLSLGFRV